MHDSSNVLENPPQLASKLLCRREAFIAVPPAWLACPSNVSKAVVKIAAPTFTWNIVAIVALIQRAFAPQNISKYMNWLEPTHTPCFLPHMDKFWQDKGRALPVLVVSVVMVSLCWCFGVWNADRRHVSCSGLPSFQVRGNNQWSGISSLIRVLLAVVCPL